MPTSPADASPASPVRLFDDPLVERAVGFLEPVLRRAADASRREDRAAEHWINLVYCTMKVLQSRPAEAIGESYAWRQHRLTMLALVAEAPACDERDLLLGLLETLDDEAAAQPATRAWLEARQRYVAWLENEGLVGEALGVLALTSRAGYAPLPPVAAMETALTAGKLYRRASRWDSALRAFREAGLVADAIGHEDGAVRAEQQAAIVSTHRGNLPDALRRLSALHERSAHLRAELRSNIAHDLGVVLERQGDKLGALARMLEAAAHSPDSEHLLRIVGDIAIVLGDLGQWRFALRAHEYVHAQSTSWTIRTNAAIESLVPLARCEPARFEARAADLLDLLPRMMPRMRVDCRYQLARGLALLGQTDRARDLLAEALNEALDHQLHQWYFRIEDTTAAILATAPAPTADDPQPEPTLARLLAGVAAFTGG